jgi:xylulokinase
VDPNFEPFYIGNILEDRLYPALMEGVGYAERYAFEHMQRMGAAVGDEICTTGGACRSDIWLRIRASILNRCLKVPKVVDAAMGSALVAASHDLGSLANAAESMIRYEKIVEPDAQLAARYEEIYRLFTEDLKRNYGVSLEGIGE